MIVFAPHNLIKDAPFTQLDLITCRNLLIYFQPAAQRKVISLFHFGLKTGGVLFLGPSENVGDLADEFTPIDRHWKIYRKRRDVRLPTEIRLPLTAAPPLRAGSATAGRPPDVETAAGLRRAARPVHAAGHADQRAPAGDAHLRAGRTVPALQAGPAVDRRARPVRRRPEDRGGRRDSAGAQGSGSSVSLSGLHLNTAGRRAADHAEASSRCASSRLSPTCWSRCATERPRSPRRGIDRGDQHRRGLARPHQHARARAPHQSREPAGDDRGAGDEQRGAAGDERGAGRLQRGAAEHQRGAALGQRGAVHGQRRVPAEDRRADRADRRHGQPAAEHDVGRAVPRRGAVHPQVHRSRCRSCSTSSRRTSAGRSRTSRTTSSFRSWASGSARCSRSRPRSNARCMTALAAAICCGFCRIARQPRSMV